MVFWKKDNEKSSKKDRQKDQMKLVFEQGGPGFCHFAITNLCDAHCAFCNFAVGNLKSKDIRSVTREDGLRSIDILYNTGIRYIIFVGGEPILHKDLLAFVEYAHDKGMTTMVCTNGGKLTLEYIDKLKEAGIDDVIISIDAPSVEIHENNRKIKNLCEKIQAANTKLRQLDIHTTASVTISKLIDDYYKLPDFLKSMGFDHVTFSYPLEHLSSSYLGYAKTDLIHYTPEELIKVFDIVKKLKKQFHVVNNTISLTEMQRFLRKQPQIFPCLGGYRYFYVDWNLDVYRCHYWESPMCKIDEFGQDRFIRDGCTRCMIDCYRDPSVMQHIAVSISDAYRLSKEKKYWQATKQLLKKSNYLSLKAISEQFKWISKLR